MNRQDIARIYRSAIAAGHDHTTAVKAVQIGATSPPKKKSSLGKTVLIMGAITAGIFVFSPGGQRVLRGGKL